MRLRGCSMSSKDLNHWYKIQIESRLGGKWHITHEISDFKSSDFNDNFERFIDKQLEGLFGIDRMVIYYDTERNLKEMEEIKKEQIRKKETGYEVVR